MKPQATRSRIWLERGLLLSGLTALAISAWFLFGAGLWQRSEDRRFEQAVRQQAQPEAKNAALAPELPGETTSPVATANAGSDNVLGRLSIPRLGMRSIVREGATDAVLARALGHIRGTALPGEPGNLAVAGHRDTLFRGLRNIVVADRIVLETVRGNYEYQVETTEVVAPDAVEVLRSGEYSQLTLVTCYPFNYIGSAPNRFIVKARLVEPVQAAPAAEKPTAKRKTAEVKPVVAPQPKSRPARKPDRATRGTHRIDFTVATGRSHELVPGQVWFGVSGKSSGKRRLSTWVWMAPARRTIWLRDKELSAPVLFRNGDHHYRLVVTRTTAKGVSGYLVRTDNYAKPVPRPHVASLR